MTSSPGAGTCLYRILRFRRLQPVHAVLIFHCGLPSAARPAEKQKRAVKAPILRLRGKRITKRKRRFAAYNTAAGFSGTGPCSAVAPHSRVPSSRPCPAPPREDRPVGVPGPPHAASWRPAVRLSAEHTHRVTPLHPLKRRSGARTCERPANHPKKNCQHWQGPTTPAECNGSNLQTLR